MAHIMVIIPYYNFFPPRGGGMLRSFHLLQELAREHQVYAIIFQPESELRQPRDGYQFPDSVQVYGPVQTPPPSTLFDQLPARLGPALHHRWLLRSWRGSANSVVLESHHLIRQILETHPIDVAIFTTISSMGVAPLVKRFSPWTVRIVNTENIEHHLLVQAVQACNGNNSRQRMLRRSYAQAHWQESHLAQSVHAFFACSDDDRNVLESLNEREKVKSFTIPNGVDTIGRSFDKRSDKYSSREALFCGSLGYQPNRDGLLWFHQKVWPLVLDRQPDSKLVVIGWNAEKYDFDTLRSDPTVDFIGEVKNSIPYYHRTGIVVVPLHTGSGTRLKILDSMSLGNPVVSTRVGAQGIKAVDGQHLLLADDHVQFAEAVVRLLSDVELFERLRCSARTLVEQKYDWRVIGQMMNEAIVSLLTLESGGVNQRRVR